MPTPRGADLPTRLARPAPLPARRLAPVAVGFLPMGPPAAVAAVRVAVRRALADLPVGCLVLVACSGGADSLALAAALAFEAPRSARRAGGLVVDHALQPGSSQRAEETGAALRRLGLAPVEVLSVTVTATGRGPEAAARAARYAALDAAAARHAAAAVLLGHTEDDQAETVLLGLARGSGARSLAGMPAVRGIYRRPLLGLARDVVRAACFEQGLEPWDDPHNADRSYSRARVRHDVLPALERALGPGVPEALARTAAQLRADADALDAWAAAASAEVSSGPGSDGELDAVRLAELPAAVRTRVLHRFLLSRAPRASVTAAHVAALDRMVTEWHGQGPVALPGGTAAVRRCGRLLLVDGRRPGRTTTGATSASGAEDGP